jgi:hypothetical protein
MDANSISAWAGLAAAIAAIVGLIIQSRQTAFALGVDLLMNLDERWVSVEMVETRRCAAKGLLEGRPEDAVELLNYFEFLGLLLHRRALDKTMVWHDLSHWILQYYDAAAEYIQKRRHEDKHLWIEFQWLYDTMVEVERKHAGEGRLRLEDDRTEFLKREVELHVHPHVAMSEAAGCPTKR